MVHWLFCCLDGQRVSFHAYSPVYCSSKNPRKWMFSFPQEVELGNPHATEICGKSAQTLKLTKGWCKIWGFSKVCQQLYMKKLDSKSPRKYLFGQTFFSKWLKLKRLFLCCEIHNGRGTLWTWTRRTQGCTFCLSEPSLLLSQPHSIRSISTFLWNIWR